MELSRATFQAQKETEAKLRERATTILSAASIVVPVAAVAAAKAKAPALAVIPFAVAIVAYGFCVRFCCQALFPQNFATGIEGGAFLRDAARTNADIRQMQATAADYFDQMHAQNQPTLEDAAEDVRTGINWLLSEILFLGISLAVTLLS